MYSWESTTKVCNGKYFTHRCNFYFLPASQYKWNHIPALPLSVCCVGSVWACGCVWVSTCMCTCRHQRRMLAVLFYHFLFYCLEKGSLIEPGARLVTRKSQWSSCLPHTALGLYVCDHAHVFRWTLMLVHQACLYAELAPQPQIIFLLLYQSHLLSPGIMLSRVPRGVLDGDR